VCREVFDEKIGSHTGHAFEDCARQYMWIALKEKKMPVAFRKIGRWWGNNPKERREEEIDVVAFAGENAVLCECKWKNALVGEDVLENLIQKAGLFRNFTNVHYMLFSKSGFTDALKTRAAKHDDVTLINAMEMFI
ncbi:MAG: DUF234 domain-containing protein, partial [Clostridiales bacterium]|nr:DUF234 domain-containing protein [Clostridiales bacterium]